MYDKSPGAHLLGVVYTINREKQGNISKSKIVPCSNVSTLEVILSVSCRYVPAASGFDPPRRSGAPKGMSEIAEEHVA